MKKLGALLAVGLWLACGSLSAQERVNTYPVLEPVSAIMPVPTPISRVRPRPASSAASCPQVARSAPGTILRVRS